MQLNPETVISIAVSAIAGGTVAYLGNRIVNAEMWGHIKNHCKEIAGLDARIDKLDEKMDKRDRVLAVLCDRAGISL